jgi:hydroxymethylbilane synthase
MSGLIRLGTRQSPLALKQADIVRQKLLAHDVNRAIQIVPISTVGDQDKKSSLADIGGKGVFIKSLEHALLNDEIDIAVHSLKDVTTTLLPELTLAGFLVPESICDCLVLRSGQMILGSNVADLPRGMVLATGSKRRKVLLKEFRPDIKTVDIRGNIETRIQRLETDKIDGVILSEAGLIRMGLEHKIHFRFDPMQFLPAPGQGVIALETRSTQDMFWESCRAINNPDQEKLSVAEGILLEKLGFDCNDPLGVYTELKENMLHMKAFIASQDFSSRHTQTMVCPVNKRDQAILSFSKLLKQLI